MSHTLQSLTRITQYCVIVEFRDYYPLQHIFRIYPEDNHSLDFE